MSAEAILLAAYAAALALGAFGLEWLSSHSHKRALRFRTSGFVYQDEHDLWVCPEDEYLWPHEFDAEKRVMRYRAKPHVCNQCTRKNQCTDSDRGREIIRPVDPWPHSEAGRFHRVISVVMVLLAMCLVVVGLVRNHTTLDIAVLGVLFVCFGFALRWLIQDIRFWPVDAPESSYSTGLRVAVTDGTGSAPRSKWASLNRSVVENPYDDPLAKPIQIEEAN